MEHAAFVQGLGDGSVQANVDRSRALQIAGSKILPKRYQVAHLFWSWVWMLSIPASFALMYFTQWWIGLLVLVFVTPALSRGVKTSACQFVIEHAQADPEFFAWAVSENVLRPYRKPFGNVGARTAKP